MTTLVAVPNPDEPNVGSPFDSIRRVREDGTEYWSARELQPFMGYSEWRNFARAIKQAMVAAQHAGIPVEPNFVAIDKNAGQVGRTGLEYELSRYGVYLTAMRGDSDKPEIAAALTYFATKTREAEVRAERPVTELELAYRYIAVLEREQELAAANAQLNEKVAELSPKAEGYDDLIAADGYMTLNAAAKALAPVTDGIGSTRFINLLRGMAVLMQNSTLPYQNLIDRGYFAVRIDLDTGSPYTAVTLKGLRWLQAELREERPTLDHGNVKELPSGSSEGSEVA